MDIDYLIIGAGISGLDLALNISRNMKSKNNILIVDGSNTYGGRIQTIYENNYNYESGAARFNKNHTKLMAYINKYKLTNKIVKIPSSWDFVNTNKKDIVSTFSNVNELLDYLINKFKIQNHKNKHYLMSKNLYDVCSEVLGINEAKYLENNHPYYSEIFIMNAYDALLSFKNDLNENLQFYCLEQGLSQVTKNMYNECLENGCKFKFNTMFNKSKFDDKTSCFNSTLRDKDDNIKLITSKNLILAIDGRAFQKLNLSNFDKYMSQKQLNFKDLQKSINVQPLLRTYAKYRKSKDDESWVNNLNKTVTNDKIKFIIPINDSFVMISYTDGKYAKYWYNKIVSFTQKEELNKSLLKIFPDKNISSNPLYIRNYYWDQGGSYWTTNIDSKKYIDIIAKPTKLNLYIIGDSFSNRQAWIEGALESSSKVFNLIK
jgi:hypothetical protein